MKGPGKISAVSLARFVIVREYDHVPPGELFNLFGGEFRFRAAVKTRSAIPPGRCNIGLAFALEKKNCFLPEYVRETVK